MALSATSSTPAIRPTPRTSPTSGWLDRACNSWCSSAPISAACSIRPRSSIRRRFSSATAVATGWPLAV
ncbi:Uncharacterised protein [Bordetella pertussis]|nr:Uncharacterised protein [Bordetella pertussis]